MNYPIHKQVGVFTNKPLEYTFSQAVNESSLYTGSVVLYDVRDGKVVEGVYSYAPVTFTLTFLPETALTANTSYTWSFAGADDPDLLPIEYEDETLFSTSVFIDFQTGEEVYTSELGLDIETNTGVILDGHTLSEVQADTFKVVSTSPSHLDSGVDVTTNSVSFTFNSALDNTQDLSSVVSFTYEPLLRSTYLFNKGAFNSVVGKVPGVAKKTTKFDMPEMEYTLSNDDKTLTASFTTSSANFNANAYVKVVVSGALMSSSTETLNTAQSESMYFLTELYPLFTTVQAVLLTLIELPGFVSEEVVLRYILKNSFIAWGLAGKGFSLTNPPPAAISFVECASVIDVIDGKNISKEMNKGKSIKLAELSLSYDYPRTPESASLSPRLRSFECMQNAKKELVAIGGNYEFKVGERGKNTSLINDVYRNRRSGLRNDSGSGTQF